MSDSIPNESPSQDSNNPLTVQEIIEAASVMIQVDQAQEPAAANNETACGEYATVVVEAPPLEEPVAEEPVAEEPVVENPVVEKAEEAADEILEEGFASLGLSDRIVKTVAAIGYTQPTPVQAEIIPHMLVGRDLLAQSETGSGKTAAFALPVLSKLQVSGKRPKVLVLAPTRELAVQVCDSFAKYGSELPKLRTLAIYGGQDYQPQLRELRRGVQVVVGTPGRVIDHIKRGTLDLSEIECLVLDEADEMLNMGFLDDVELILKQTPPTRQTALFSATLPDAIRKISKRYLNDPTKVTIKKKAMTADAIRQRAMFMAPRNKVTMLKLMLEVEEPEAAIVFTKTKESTLAVAEKLAADGIAVAALNGDMPQKVRQRTIEQLKSGKLNVLVATDVAARGLDVTRLSHVFNYDLPHDPESYVHRVGRTGRAGRKGEAIIFLSKAQRGKLRTIERVTRQKIEVVDAPTADTVNENRVRRFKERIDRVINARDLGIYEKLIAESAAESGHSVEKIAAALAHIAQNGRPFFFKDMPKNDRRRDDKREGGRHERGDNAYGGKPRHHQHGRSFGPPEDGMKRYRLAVGRRDGVKPGNIVGAIANEAGIDGEYIGPIQIQESYTTVDLPEGMPSEVFESLKQARVSGRQMQIREEREGFTGSGYPRKRGKSDFRKKDGKRGGPGGGKSKGGKRRGGEKVFASSGSGGPSHSKKSKSKKGKRKSK